MADGEGPVLTGIHIHPIKSCRRVELSEAQTTPLGIAGDRLWQIYDDNTFPVTQRQHKVLATVAPEPIDGGLRVSAPGHDPIEIATPSDNDASIKSLFGVSVAVGDGGDEAAAWFSAVVGESVRIGCIVDGTGWKIPDPFGSPCGSMGFTDATPVLLASESSCRWLSERASEPFGIERFRPNLIIDGATPWEEDTWQSFRVGDTEFDHWLPWPRCPIPQIDQDTADRHAEPALALKQHRWCTDGGDEITEPTRKIVENNALFGIGCFIADPAATGAVIRVGDQIEVTQRREPLLPPPA